MVNSSLFKSKIVEQEKDYSSVAECISVTKGTLSRKVNNKVPFSITEAEKIAVFLHLSITDIQRIFFTELVA